MPLFQYKKNKPVVDVSAFIAPTATVIGSVRIGKNASVWFGSVLRGDSDSIDIGDDTNIQDLTMCHVDPGHPLVIGNLVTIGHNCVMHGCSIGDNCLVGMGSVIMNGAQVGKGSVVAAGTVILENTVIPPFSMVTGIPGKVKKTFDNQEEMLEIIKLPAHVYLEKKSDYQSGDLFVEIK